MAEDAAQLAAENDRLRAELAELECAYADHLHGREMMRQENQYLCETVAKLTRERDELKAQLEKMNAKENT